MRYTVESTDDGVKKAINTPSSVLLKRQVMNW